MAIPQDRKFALKFRKLPQAKSIILGRLTPIMRGILSFSIVILFNWYTTALSFSAPVTIPLGGNQTTEGWSNFNPIIYPGHGEFPGFGSWASPFASNSGSGDSTVNKTANGSEGGPFFGSASSTIYSGGFSTTPNTFGGTLAISEATPIDNLKTIVFQLQMGEAFGYALFDNEMPTLFINGEALSLAANFSSLFQRVENGTFTPPGGSPEPLYINTWAFQWDLSSYLQPITSFEIQFSTVQHSQVYAMQLDQSDAINLTSQLPAAIPEPSVYVMFAAGILTLLILRKMRPHLRS